MHIPGLLLANSTRAMDQALEQATGGGAPQPAESTAYHQASSSKGVVYRAVEQARAVGAPAGAIEHVKTPVTVASRCSSCCTVFPGADRCMLCMGCKLMFCNRCIGAHKRAGPCRPCRQQAHAVGPVATAMRIKATPIGNLAGADPREHIAGADPSVERCAIARRGGNASVEGMEEDSRDLLRLRAREQHSSPGVFPSWTRLRQRDRGLV